MIRISGEAFEVLASELGGEYSLRPTRTLEDLFLTQIMERWIEDVRAIFEERSPSPADAKLEIGLLKRGTINAAAAIIDGVDVIGINLGTIYIIRELFDKLLSHPAVLPNIGDASLEKERWLCDPSRAVTDWEIDMAKGRPFCPNDPQRAHHASRLFLFAIDFIFHHELGHLFNGHVNWLLSTTGFRALPEVGASAIAGLTSIDRQTLEMDADSFGGLVCTKIAIGAAIQNRFESKREALSAALFAIFSLFRIFGGSTIGTGPEILESDHPPAFYRWYLVEGTIMEIVHKFSLFTREEYADMAADIFIAGF
jgi:hypothetical protein